MNFGQEMATRQQDVVQTHEEGEESRLPHARRSLPILSVKRIFSLSLEGSASNTSHSFQCPMLFSASRRVASIVSRLSPSSRFCMSARSRLSSAARSSSTTRSSAHLSFHPCSFLRALCATSSLVTTSLHPFRQRRSRFCCRTSYRH